MSTAITAFKAMETDIQISMDDVVSAFVSQYENNLYARKKELTASIRTVEKNVEDFLKALHRKINGSSFKTTLPFDMVMSINDGSVEWRTSKMNFEISITLKNNSRYGNTITVLKNKPIPAADVRTHEALQKELSGLRTELGEVLVSLKSVNRKERQVRGRIAIRKLEDSGYANLMQDEELVQLVQLED